MISVFTTLKCVLNMYSYSLWYNAIYVFRPRITWYIIFYPITPLCCSTGSCWKCWVRVDSHFAQLLSILVKGDCLSSLVPCWNALALLSSMRPECRYILYIHNHIVKWPTHGITLSSSNTSVRLSGSLIFTSKKIVPHSSELFHVLFGFIHFFLHIYVSKHLTSS